MQVIITLIQQVIALLFNPALLFVAIVVVIFAVHNKNYKQSAYYRITKRPYTSVRYNLGRYGEYMTYKHLKHYEQIGARFLVNVYIPKENGESTEIDLLMISPKGIFVFESKNYSGWIFGSENQKNWYQTLPKGRGRSNKEHFYNPIMQNRSHIKHLQAFLGTPFPIYSIIVFSDRCTLKRVQITSNDVRVVHRWQVRDVVSAIFNQTPANLLNENDIAYVYGRLYPCTQVDAATKQQHIANIHSHTHIPPVQSGAMHYQQAAASIIVENQTDAISIPPAEIVQPEQKTEAVSTPKCPYCQGNLVLRTATRGANAGNQFYGCSNYPKCKYIQNVQH